MSVKRIMLFLAPAILATVVVGCGKDHEAPTFDTYSVLVAPTSFVASYDSASAVFSLSWSLTDTASVSGYNIAFSDTSTFEGGNSADVMTNTLDSTYTITPTILLKKLLRTKMQNDSLNYNDSLIVYFKVAAVYNDSTFMQFVGPYSDVDSARIR